ncbi:unnamed protein product [Brassicogethes aeneus]|uniref:C2H2-type domain-containing protein n=1 Tax=Brassicogethes aeneus TaxID=1431903 RepID=A0A9P0BHT8_BRAAE|nr:unnamed protein product [Brassicogethes aeneus]
MEQIVVKSEPEELVDDYKGDILMNYANQEMSSTSGIPINIEQIYIKQEIKEEFKTEDEMLLNEGTYSEVENKEILAKIDFPKTEKESRKEQSLKSRDKVEEEKWFKCDLCPKKYPTKGNLFRHKNSVHKIDEPEQFKCGKCEYQALTKRDFKYHLNIHDEKNLKCHFCPYIATQILNLNAHILSTHKSCLNANKKTHTKKTPNKTIELKCLFCQYKSGIKKNLDNHILTIHSSLLNKTNKNIITSKIHHCEQCDYKTTQIKFQEEVKEEKLYKCDVCPKNYKTGGGLKEHKRHIHNKGEQVQYKCCKCGYKTARRGHLNYHLKIHDKDKYLKCRFCQYMAAGSQTLNAHLISKHRLENEGENKIKITSKIHECPKCSYSTVRKNDYNNHIKACLKLKNVKWHKCDLCHFRTITISNLNTHIKTHNKIKELKCLFCSYQCNLKQNLDNHILIKHFDLLNESNQNLITSKVHCCQHCNYKTTNTSDLKKHLSRKH